MGDSLHIAFVASEVAPFMKTGGLADVAAALPKALGRLGHRVTIFLPRYGPIPYPAGAFAGSVHVPVDATPRSAGFYRRELGPNVEIVFVEHPPFFDRPQPYGEGNRDYPDNRLRFAFLSRASLEYFRSRGERPEVFHAHDWQAGMVPVFLKSFYWDDPTLHRTPTVFTIHNLAYQGNFAADTGSLLGLPWNIAAGDALEFHGGVSYMKGGVLFAEAVNTVSPTYAREIQTQSMGYGFDGVLRGRGADLSGIVNGVDYDEWDPAVDPHIARKYGPADVVAGKAACKADLLRRFGLASDPDLPVIGIVSRLVALKGHDIVTDAWYDLMQRPLRMVVVGTGEPKIQDAFRALAERDPARFGVRFVYDEALAHQVEAGADMFLMPSRFEPCGLTQMYSLRYGTVPIVRATGGLVDTVEPYDAATGAGTGFRFDHADGTGLMWAVDQALAVYADKPAWGTLVQAGMSRDFSWQRSAEAYETLYRRAMEQV